MSTNYPATFYAANLEDGGNRPQIFDPALKEFQYAFRAGDPEFARPEDAIRWREARRLATDHVLRLVAESPWGKQLVLRGSRLLKAWFGDEAREPGDLDYVVRPATLQPTDSSGVAMLNGLRSCVASRPGPAGIDFLHDMVACDNIWTYERAEGRRIVFPWQTRGLPGGAVQVDIVFAEELTEPPILTQLALTGGEIVLIWTAGVGQSFAWKVLWLETDINPQGKDLYDAAILAEHVFLPRTILEQIHHYGVARPSDNALEQIRHTRFVRPFEKADDLIADWRVEWDHFANECPWVQGGLEDWSARLIKAIKPSFASCEQPKRSVLFPPHWKSWEAMSLAQGIVEAQAFGRLSILADALEEAGCENADVLAHCRGGLHHEGNCWVIDSLLRNSNSQVK
ncbi:nucleotidyl transferase AbiEii/AbiGii toxin family protein [Zavarzinella formosa]|uniref:nucleotidyl transferase AbiEii/AbiGii toxin family protein n=1 Tax=Zavarzinella formosa TaxID=360055 RepID=UPI0002D6AFD0|nr:nucleotidyl transferase AbiEii/AbiGii toxin family protein [Zavarzinella formosa]